MESRSVDKNLSTQLRDPWSAFLEQGMLGAASLIGNAEVAISSLKCGDQVVPVTTNRRGDPDCSWVTSLRNAYGPYARAETDIVQMNRFLQPLYIAGSHVAEAVLSAGGLAGGNFLNNWLLATNLYLPEFCLDDIQVSTRLLCQRDPCLPVLIRSLTAPLHADLLKDLSEAGFLLLPSRQVWLVPNPVSLDWRKHRDARRDVALAHATKDQWTWVPARDFTDQDYADAWRLYQRLYREKYPRFNPDYTEQFLRAGVATGFLHIEGLRATGAKKLSGFVGMVHRAEVSCTPLLGYDIDAPSSTGLYRLLMLRAFGECEKRATKFHCSAGAGLFKFNRGAESHVEFAAVWANHLPLYRRANLRALASAVNRWVVPYLESHQL
jgi:hypothetical protein